MIKTRIITNYEQQMTNLDVHSYRFTIVRIVGSKAKVYK